MRETSTLHEVSDLTVQQIVEFNSQLLLARQQSSQLRAMLDTVPIAMFFIDTDFNILYCNEEIVNAMGAPSKDDLQMHFSDYYPEYQADGVLTTDKMSLLMSELFSKGTLEFEWTHLHPIDKQSTNKLTAVCGIYQGRQGAFIYRDNAKEVIAVKERMQFMFDATPLVICYWDRHGNCIDCNKFTIDFYELNSKKEYINQTMQFFPEFQPDGSISSEMWHKNIGLTFENAQRNFPFVAKKKDGSTVHYDVLAFSIKSDDEFIVVTFSRDTTDETYKEIALANSEAKSKFLARMSHELRTPISVIMGISEIELQNAEHSNKLNESFNKIHETSAMLLSLVSDILDLSKVEAGKMDLNEAVYETENLVGDIISFNSVLKGEKNIEFKLIVDEQLPVSLTGDYVRLKQIISNLLSNAFKYTEVGVVELSFEYQHTNFIIKVRDTGIGMDTDQLEKLYADYSRFHEKELPQTSGIGLGMAIVYSLIQLMSGTIDITSNVGEGTCVTVRVPQQTSTTTFLGRDIAQKLQDFEVSKTVRVHKQKYDLMPYGKVLVVDDIDANLYVAKGLLSFYSLQVETCDRGQTAIDKIKDGNVYDVVFMDHMMPELDGIETTQILRSLGYNSPIIALTANALLGQAEEFVKRGFDGFMSKPIDTKQLNENLVKYIKDKQTPEVLAATAENIHENKKNIDNYLTDMADKLRLNFKKSQKNAIQEMRLALDQSDIETVHRKAHSLKGLAGLICEQKLAKVALSVEEFARDGKVSSHHLDMLEAELEPILDNIDPEPSHEMFARVLDKDFAKEVFDKLHPMLVSRNTACLSLTDKLRTIPESAVLVRQMEEYEFSDASKTLETLRLVLDV